jgi:multimeric flavodoxin WrbA
MSYKILGISGSPVTNGNVDSFLASIIGMAVEKGLETETVSLSKMEIDSSVRIGILEDQAGLDSGKAILSRALELVELIHK